jgi:THO complex subunit 4
MYAHSCNSGPWSCLLTLFKDLFTRIAPVTTVSLRYDRAGRSAGIAYVTYPDEAHARTAIREFDGANAKGQPIRLTLLPSGPRARPTGRRDNPFDRIENPRSLFDRVEAPKGRRAPRERSASPDDHDDYDHDDDRNDSRRRRSRRGPPTVRDRRSDVTKPPPDNIDRYVPGLSDERSSSRRRGGRENGRRPGERREGDGRSRSDRGENGVRMVNGRPRKTQEELDAEMEDYWGNANTAEGNSSAPTTAPAAAATAPGNTATAADDDIDMID